MVLRDVQVRLTFFNRIVWLIQSRLNLLYIYLNHVKCIYLFTVAKLEYTTSIEFDKLDFPSSHILKSLEPGEIFGQRFCKVIALL